MPKRAIPSIENDLVRLRLLQENDLPMTLRWRNQDHIRRWFFCSDVITPEQHTKWFLQHITRDDDFVFIIEQIHRNYRPVGQVALYNIDWTAFQAEFGRLMIGEPDASSKGLARAATRAALRIAFDHMELNKVLLEVYAENRKAIAIYEEIGFKTDGTLDNIRKMSISANRTNCRSINVEGNQQIF